MNAARAEAPEECDERSVVVIGLVAAEDDRELAEELAKELPNALREQLDGRTAWRAEVVEAEPADASASPSELVASVRRRLQERGWQLGIGLTALPLRVDRRPVAAHASASHGVGLVSIPALGAVNRDDRLREAAVSIVEGLLGESHRGSGAEREQSGERITARSAELATPIDEVTARERGTFAFAGAVVRGNLRLLAGMIRANRPTRVMARLSRSSTAALGTGAYALSSANIWVLAHDSSWPRLLGVALLAMMLILVALVIAHGLWERAKDPTARERVVLFNIVTITTLAIGVATLYLALFAGMLVAAAVVIPPTTLEAQTSDEATLGEYARLAWMVASVATVGGALGSLVESNDAVREAAYRPRTSEAA